MQPQLAEALRLHAPELRQRMMSHAGIDTQPEVASDADLLFDAFVDGSLGPYAERFTISGRDLAAHGGHLAARLAGLHRWSSALAAAVLDVLAGEDSTAARALQQLNGLTAQAAAALATGYERAVVEHETAEAERARRGTTRLHALERINAAANSTLDLDQTLTTTAHAVAEEMGADLCAIFLFDEVTRELQLRATNGVYPRIGQHFTLTLGRGYTGYVAEHGHPLVVHDTLADPRFADESRAYEGSFRGLLSVPIIFFTVEKLEGVISVQTHDARTFSDEEMHFLEIVAGQLAMSIENGRLYEQTDEELRRKVHELSTLHRVSALVASTLVFDNVLRTIVAQAVQLSGADRSVLFELDPATQQLRAVASHGFNSPAIDQVVLHVGQCCAGRVVQTGQPSMKIDCMRSDAGCFLHNRPEAIDDQHAVLCVPLTARQGPIGALCIFSSQRHLLNDHQLQLVMTFANVAAIAMENARLFEQTREGLRAKEVLLREMHHRVKNNLQQVAAILNMQRRRARNPEVEQILVESVDRIQGIAATHDLLSNTQLGMARIDEIARKIVGIVRGNLVPPHLTLRFHIGSIAYDVPSEQATTLAIILNELIANAIEHGFEGRDHGAIRITGGRAGDHLVVRVADDGAGLPGGFSVATAEGLGLQLVRGLVQTDLRGAFTVFQAAGDPDIGERGERATDPLIAAIDRDGRTSAPVEQAERTWTIAQLTFPAAFPLPSESLGLTLQRE